MIPTWPVRYWSIGVEREQKVEGEDGEESGDPGRSMISGRWSWCIGEELLVLLILEVYIGSFYICGETHIDCSCDCNYDCDCSKVELTRLHMQDKAKLTRSFSAATFPLRILFLPYALQSKPTHSFYAQCATVQSPLSPARLR